MKIKMIVVGKTKERFLQQGEKEFQKRIQRYVDVEWVIIKQEKITEGIDKAKVKIIEGERIKKNLRSGEWIIALDSNANQMTSEKFADLFQEKMFKGDKCITFIIGGTLGLSQDIFQHVNEKLSLSKMTFTHEMTRLILLEQIYRAFTIIKGEKYHK